MTLSKKFTALATSGVALLALNGCSQLNEEKTTHNNWDNQCGVEVDLRQSGRISLDLSLIHI